MKVSINWLKEYIDLKGISVNQIIERLTISGLEVEDVYYQNKKYENIFVGLTTEVQKHPNADKLSVCKVSDGKEIFEVVCGAPNVIAGQKVPFAKVGAIVPKSGFLLSQVKIRGVISNGMICSEDELELGSDADGILVLDNKLKVGQKLSKALGLEDVILEVAITPNRSDALSHIGIARDLSAIFSRKLNYPEVKINESKIESAKLAKIVIKDKIGCPRYVGKVIQDVTIKESPDWLKMRLKSIGLRPINNVVDVTNFVLHEIGQPLHAFDLNFLDGKKIIVRKAESDQKFISLDSKERELKNDDLMICDSNKPVAIAGIMGGENSEVKSDTKTILIESAFFNPSRIRKTAKRLGLSTDASYRFERGTDPGITQWAARRAVQLICNVSGGTAAKGEIDIYPQKITIKKINLRFTRITKILGYEIPKNIVKKILTCLGFQIKSIKPDSLMISVPTNRHDIEREIDLIEEVARIYGYDKVPNAQKVSINLEESVDNSAFTDKLRLALTSLGLYEIVTNSFVNSNVANKFGNTIKIMNPQNSEMSHLRTSLLSGMMQTISNNLRVNEKDLKLFEIGKVFNLRSTEINSFADFQESEQLIMAFTGNAIDSEWYSKARLFDIYDFKGIWEGFASKLFPYSINQLKESIDSNIYAYALDIIADDKKIGICGKVSQEVCYQFDVNAEVFVATINIDSLKNMASNKRSFYELLKFQKVYRDVAFIIYNNIKVGEVIGVIKEAATNLLHNIKLFDIFQSESLGSDKKSLAFQLEFYNSNKTLTEEEVESEFKIIVQTVSTKFKSQLRGS